MGETGVATEPKSGPLVVEHERDTLLLQEVSDKAWELRSRILNGPHHSEFETARRKKDQSLDIHGSGKLKPQYGMDSRKGSHLLAPAEFFTYEKDGRTVHYSHYYGRGGAFDAPYRPEEFIIETEVPGDIHSREATKIVLGRNLVSIDGNDFSNTPEEDGPVVQFKSESVYYEPAPGKKLPVRNTLVAMEQVTDHILGNL